MNPYVKAMIKKTIQANTVVRTAHAGTDEYSVNDANGKTLILFVNGWDYGQYSIFIGDKKIADIQWYENQQKPLTPEQKDVFEILDIMLEKNKQQEQAKRNEQLLASARAKMSPAEIAAMNFLQNQK